MADVLLIHAFPLDASMWDEQVAALRDEHRVIAPSLPGFGGTPAGGDVLTMEAMAEHLVGEMDSAGIDRAVVCGLSMGGYAAFELWRRVPQRISGLLLADTRAEADDDAGREKRAAVAEKARTQGSGAIAEAPPPLLSEGVDPDLWDRVKASIRRQPGEAIAAAALGIGERPDSTETLGTIDVPTTVLVGSADTLTPPELSEKLAAGIDGSELVVLDGAGHLSNLEAPEGFLAALRNLLQRIG